MSTEKRQTEGRRKKIRNADVEEGGARGSVVVKAL
jgi:hypothetical protein